VAVARHLQENYQQYSTYESSSRGIAKTQVKAEQEKNKQEKK